MCRFCACLIDSLSRLSLMARKIRAYGSARSISNLSFWAQLGSSNIKLEFLGSARLQQIKHRATLTRLSSTKNCWLEHPCSIVTFNFIEHCYCCNNQHLQELLFQYCPQKVSDMHKFGKFHCIKLQ